MNKITKFVVLVAVCLLGLFSCNEKTSNDYLVYDFRGKYGYVDRKGNVVIEPQFDDARSFSEGLAWAEKDGKTGYIDKTGEFVIDLDGKEGENFSEGLAAVKNMDNKYGFIDKNGHQVIEFKYDEACSFSDGIARVRKGEKLDCIDNKGNTVIKFDYVWINEFHEGLAFVWIDDDHPRCIDKKGNIVIEELPDRLRWSRDLRFSEGLACVDIDGKYGYIDKTGKIVIEPQFSRAENFSNGLALFSDGKGGLGYIDKKGKVVIKPKYEWAKSFSEGLAAVCLKNDDGSLENRKYFYIDKNEKMITDSLFCRAFDFHDGIALVEVYDEGYNYVDKKGRLLINRNESHLEKLFNKGLKYNYGIRDYLIDNELKKALTETYGEKWFDMLKYMNWGNYTEYKRTRFNKNEGYYRCMNYTVDEFTVGILSYYPEKNEIVSDVFILDEPFGSDLDKAIKVMSDGKAQCGNWKEDYFVNEFNEKDYDYPYVYISLPGVYTPENWNVNIRIMYSKEGFRIVQEEDITWDTDIVIRRDSDGQTFRVPYKEYGAGGIVSDYDYCEWISDVLNEGNFTIKVGSTISRVTDETRGFKGAVINMRGGFFSPTPNNASSSSEFHQQSNSGVSQFVVIDGSQLRLRLAPSTSSDTFKWPDGTNRHPNVGDKYRYLGESGDFYKIDFNGNELWVSKQYTHLE